MSQSGDYAVRPSFACAAATWWRATRAGAAYLCTALLPAALSAQTVVSGPITADARWTTAGSPYVVAADVAVQGGATLVIDAGVVVSMAVGTRLTVQAGTLRALGTAASPVRVQSERTRLGELAAPGDWDQWVFGPGTTAATRLDHVHFAHGRGLAVLGSAPVLNHLDIRHQQGAAITIDLAASPSGVGNRASDNGLNGIAVPAGIVTATTRWGLRGIPYVVPEGTVSVGVSPAVSGVSPTSVEQGQTLTLAVNGTRLTGASAATLDRPGLVLTPASGGSATQARFQLAVAADAALGPATLRLQVDAGDLVLPSALTVTPPLPAITALTPATVVAGTGPTVLTLDGRNFLASSVVTADAADLATEFVDATRLRATLPLQTAAATLQLQVRSPNAQQPQQPLLSNGVALAVQAPVPPVLAVEPTPLALPPDGAQRSYQLALNRADFRDHSVAIASDHPAIAAVSPASLTIAAGQTRAVFQVRGLAAGQTTLRLSSATLGNLAVPVFVTVDYAGINTANAPVVGVQFDTEPVPPVPTAAGAYSASLGLTLGTAWIDSAPGGVIAGGEVTLQLRGVAWPADLNVAIQPPEGITLGPVSVNAEGTVASVPLGVAADAVPGMRRLVVRSGTQVLAAAAPLGERFSVWRDLPVITSVQPLLGLPGSTIGSFVVRGHNLSGALPLEFAGGDIVVASDPQVTADGTQLTTAISVPAGALPGPRTVVVTTPSGASDRTPGSANTFHVVQEAGATYANLAAPVVGVALDAAPAPVSSTLGVHAATVGVGLGRLVHAVQPGTGATGQDLVLTFAGSELADVTAATITPATGITLGTPVPAADGRSVQLPLAIAADAPLTARRVQLLAGATAVPAAEGGERFVVVAPVPELVSLRPLVVTAGTSVTLTLRGIHLQNATQVRLTPAAGITVSPPVYNAADPLGPSLSVTLVVDAAAAPGARVVTVLAPAGESSAVAVPANTLTLAATAGTTYPVLASADVGVELAAVAVPVPPPPPVALVAFDVGVEVAEVPTPPASRSVGVQAPQVGLAVGGVVTRVEPTGLSPGQGGVLVVRGIGLPADAVVAFRPAAGIVLEGAPVVASDGSMLTQPISIAVDAPLQARMVEVSSAAGLLPIEPMGNTWFSVGGVPQTISLAPILARQGETLTLTIRGTHLGEVLELIAEPAAGLQFVSAPVVAADGSQLTVSVAVAPDAPTGARVIRARTRSGITAAEGDATNTFTVYP